MRPGHGRQRPLDRWMYLGDQEVASVLACSAARVEMAMSGSDRAKANRDEFLIRLALASGLRVSELVGLRVGCLVRVGDENLVAIELGAKNHLRRTIFIDAALMTDLEAWLAGYPKAMPIFRSTGNRAMTVRRAQQLWVEIAAQAGLPWRPRFHALRHTHAVQYLRAGGTLVSLQARLGHRSLAETTRYLHASADDSRTGAEALGALLVRLRQAAMTVTVVAGDAA